MTPVKKSVLALAVVALPFSLAACGSDEPEATTDVAASTVTSTSAAPSSEAPTSEEKTTEETTTEEATPAEEENPEAAGAGAAAAGAEGDQAPETLVNPFENGQNPLEGGEEIKPIEGGQPADEAVRNEIIALNEGLYGQQGQRDFMRYVPEHTCKRVLDQQPQELQTMNWDLIPNTPMSQMQPGWENIKVSEIRDLKVDGDVASGTVIVDMGNGQTDQSTMRFAREGGAWKYCN